MIQIDVVVRLGFDLCFGEKRKASDHRCYRVTGAAGKITAFEIGLPFFEVSLEGTPTNRACQKMEAVGSHSMVPFGVLRDYPGSKTLKYKKRNRQENSKDFVRPFGSNSSLSASRAVKVANAVGAQAVRKFHVRVLVKIGLQSVPAVVFIPNLFAG